MQFFVVVQKYLNLYMFDLLPGNLCESPKANFIHVFNVMKMIFLLIFSGRITG